MYGGLTWTGGRRAAWFTQSLVGPCAHGLPARGWASTACRQDIARYQCVNTTCQRYCCSMSIRQHLISAQYCTMLMRQHSISAVLLLDVDASTSYADRILLDADASTCLADAIFHTHSGLGMLCGRAVHLCDCLVPYCACHIPRCKGFVFPVLRPCNRIQISQRTSPPFKFTCIVFDGFIYISACVCVPQCGNAPFNVTASIEDFCAEFKGGRPYNFLRLMKTPRARRGGGNSSLSTNIWDDFVLVGKIKENCLSLSI